MAATDHSQSIKQDSKEYLTTALLQILENKDLNEITVTQVVKRAGVSRMAFYRNFDSLTDLLTAYFEPKISTKFLEIQNGIPEDKKLNSLGEFFSELADTMKLAKKRGFEFVIQNIFNQQMTLFYRDIIPDNELSEVSRNYWTKFMSAGVYSIWREWLLNGQKETLDQIHQIIATFQNSTMSALLQKDKSNQ